MTRVVWKVQLNRGSGTTFLEIPRTAELLTLQVQHDYPTIWFVCSDTKNLAPRKFITVVTGETFECENWSYVGTYQREDYVYHVWVDEE